MSDIVLVYPKTGVDLGPTIGPPHSVMAIAALPKKAGYSVRIVDQRLDHEWRRTLEREVATHPLLVGISAMTGSQIHFGLEVARHVRFLDDRVPLVWGGPHPTSLPEQTLENEYVDVVCVGDGEVTLKELADALSSRSPLATVAGLAYKDGGRPVRTAPRPPAPLDDLPEEDWSLVDVERYIHPDLYMNHVRRVLDVGQTSRGCPFRCGMCGIGGRNGWRARSAERSVDYIARMVKEHRLDGLWLRDDEFFIREERAVRICEGMIPLRIAWYGSGTRIDLFNRTPDSSVDVYKRSGAYKFKFGAESGSDRILDLIGKGFHVEDVHRANLKAKRLGIVPAYTMMIGLPTETFAEMDETVDMILRMEKENPAAKFETLLVYTPIAGTPLWELSLKHGFLPPRRLEDWIEWRFDEYDLEGRRIPWYPRRDRRAIGNLCYLTSLTHIVPTILESYRGVSGALLRGAYSIPEAYFRWRFRTKRYRAMPELGLIRKMRDWVFYK